MRFEVDPSDCALLLAVHETGSLARASRELGRDPSVLARKLQRLALDTDLVEKVGGAWRVSARGRELALWTRDAIQRQRQALSAPLTLRLGAVPTFLERVLCPALAGAPFAELRRAHRLEILSPAEGLETALLRGTVDVGFACGRPKDPLIRFKKAGVENWSLVAAPTLAESLLKRAKSARLAGLSEFPVLRHRDVVPEEFLELSGTTFATELVFDLTSSLRAAAVAGLGWALMPTFAARGEPGLVDHTAALGLKPRREFYGVWWLKGNRAAEGTVETLGRWLSEQPL
jgi:DNA-binding transcriptional LysR family regulator